MKNFGFLGYKAGENKYSYPRPTEDKIISLLNCLKQLADYIVVDCSKDIISSMAVAESDTVIQMITPDLKCLTYYISNKDKYLALENKTVKIINIKDRDIYLPVNDIREHFNGAGFILPYSQPVKQQCITGTLSEKLTDSKYNAIISGVVKAVI